MIVGAVDIGSNSMRLLIVDGNLDVRVNRRSITQLGAGVDATGRFNAAAMAKTLAVMDEFGELLRAHDVDVLAAVATSATRDASNGAEFVAEVARRIGMVPEVISGTREAALSFAGATRGRTDGPYLVVDIGGGSTEFIRGDGSIESGVSIDVGCVRIAERYGLTDVASAQKLDVARSMVAAALVDVPTAEGATVVGVAGTFNALATYIHQRDPYHRESFGESSVTLTGIIHATDELAPLTANQRGLLSQVHVDRASTIVAGSVIAACALQSVGVDTAVVSPTGLVHGLAAELLGI